MHWKLRLISKERRVAYVQTIITASVIYQLMALYLEPWFLNVVDKVHRGYLCASEHEASGERCMVAWHLVCRPKQVGGLGCHNLKMLNVSLPAKWTWLIKTGRDRPWLGIAPNHCG